MNKKSFKQNKKGILVAAAVSAVSIALLGSFVYLSNSPKGVATSQKEVSQAKEQVVESAAYFNKNLSFFSTGQPLKANAVYIFFDPRCIYCAALWESSKQVQGQKFNWIPVGLLSNKSVQISMEILASKNPIETMEENEEIIKKGGLGIETSESREEFLEKVKKNTLAFQALGFNSVPFILAPNPNGAGFIRKSGAMSPEEFKAFLEGKSAEKVLP